MTDVTDTKPVLTIVPPPLLLDYFYKRFENYMVNRVALNPHVMVDPVNPETPTTINATITFSQQNIPHQERAAARRDMDRILFLISCQKPSGFLDWSRAVDEWVDNHDT